MDRTRAVDVTSGQYMKRMLLLMVRAYQRFVSPFTPPVCRFYPSCSEYAVQAVSRYGSWKGVRLVIARLMRCHPLHPGGYDPVP